jgi:predicted RNase H-like HicB family nuclease
MGGGFLVRVPKLPEIVTNGDTDDEALRMAEDAIRLVVEFGESTESLSLLIHSELQPASCQSTAIEAEPAQLRGSGTPSERSPAQPPFCHRS